MIHTQNSFTGVLVEKPPLVKAVPPSVSAGVVRLARYELWLALSDVLDGTLEDTPENREKLAAMLARGWENRVFEVGRPAGWEKLEMSVKPADEVEEGGVWVTFRLHGKYPAIP